MKPVLEKLIPPTGSSFRCFDRSVLKTEIKWHRHPEIEINFVPKGSGTRMIGDHVGPFSDGDLVLLGSNLPHTWLSDEYVGKRFDRHKSTVIQFLPDTFGLIFDLPEMTAIKKLVERSKRGIWFQGQRASEVGVKMTQLIEQKGELKVIGLLECLSQLSKIGNTKLLATPGYSSEFETHFDVRIQSVCQFVNSNLTDPFLDLGQIPELVDMNPSAFSRFFKKTTGRTLTRYVNELRVGLACRKLADTNNSILEVSLDVGYGNLSNFNRQFKVIKRVTPRQFRNQAANAIGKTSR